VAIPAGAAVVSAPDNALHQKVDALTGLVKELSAAHAAVAAELKSTKSIAATALAALHHMYLMDPALAGPTNGQANELPHFVKFMEKYLGSVGNPN
jgi:hypothetical protein